MRLAKEKEEIKQEVTERTEQDMKNAWISQFALLSPVKSAKVIASILAVIVGAALLPAFAQEKSDDELVKELANPISSLISVPFQNNFEFNLGPNNDGFKYTLNFQPVIPFSMNKDWNLITRTIVPIIDQSDVIAPNTSQGGLSDITQSFFFSPKKPVAGMIIGAGPVFLYPSATDDLLGSEKWGAGPTIVLLKQEGPWTVGLLLNHIWSFAGDDHRNYVSSTFLQPFIAYATKTKTTFTLNTESTYDWHNEQWTVPINLLVSQLIKIGKQPVQLGLGAKVYAEGPSGAPEWGIRFVVTPLFPTGKRRRRPPASSAK
jgi:hypothetical protein